MSVVHAGLAGGRWHTMTLAEQLGNVGSEYERAHRSRQQGDAVRFRNASDRFLELLDLTLADSRWRGRRLQELARIRETACEELFASEKIDNTLGRYFFYFAVSARRLR